MKTTNVVRSYPVVGASVPGANLLPQAVQLSLQAKAFARYQELAKQKLPYDQIQRIRAQEGSGYGQLVQAYLKGQR